MGCLNCGDAMVKAVDMSSLHSQKTFNDDLLPYIRGKKILSIGCGNGLNDLIYGNEKSLGIDCDKEKILEGKKRYLRIEHGWAGKHNFKGEKFEVVTIFHVLEHLETRAELQNTLKSAYNVLKNNGYLIIAVPYAYDSNAWTHWQHERVFTHNSLKDLVERAGFKVEKQYSFWHLPFENKLINDNLIGNFKCPFKRDYIIKILATFNLVRDIHLIARKR